MSTVILYIALFIGIIPLVVLLFKSRAFDKAHPLVPFVWLTALAVVYEYVGSILLKNGTAYWFQVYNLLEFVCFYYFFYKALQGRFRTVFYFFLLVFGTVYLFSLFQWDRYNALKTITINAIPTVLFIFTFSYLWFKNLFDNTDVPNLWQNENFYFVSGFFIYHSSTFFLFLLSNFIFESEKLYLYDYWFVNVLATLVLRIFMIIGVCKMRAN